MHGRIRAAGSLSRHRSRYRRSSNMVSRCQKLTSRVNEVHPRLPSFSTATLTMAAASCTAGTAGSSG